MQLLEANRAFEEATVTRPEPKMVKMDITPRSVMLAIWRGAMECLEVWFDLNRWWPGRRDRPR